MLQILFAESNPDLQITIGVDRNAPNLVGPSNYLASMKNNVLWNDCKNWVTCPATLQQDIARKNNISEVKKAKMYLQEQLPIRQAQFQDGSERCGHYGAHENIVQEINKVT